MNDPFSLKNEREVAQDILKNFSAPKIICGIKDEDVKIELNTSKIWMVSLLGIPILTCFMVTKTNNILLGLILSIIIGLSILIIWYKIEKHKIYFENGKLIYENGFGYKKIIDIMKYPKIYATYRRYDTYSYYQNGRGERLEDREYLLYIKQGNDEIVLDIYGKGNDKFNLLLDNLIFKEKED